MIAFGFSTKQIAKEMNISENTVKVHRKNILKVLNASNSANAVQKYYETKFPKSFLLEIPTHTTPRKFRHQLLCMILVKVMTSFFVF